MGLYDNRGTMLDAGRTALALRGLQNRDGHYPFIERFAPRRRPRSRLAGSEAARKTPTAFAWWRPGHWFVSRDRSSAIA